MTAPPPVATEDGWSRRRLVGVLATVAAVGLVLVAALVHTVLAELGSSPETTSGATEVRHEWPVRAGGTRGPSYRDAVAARPMLATTNDDLRPAAPSLEPGPTINVGAAGATGPAGVATGFERTPEGAVGQLAAIEVAALGPMDVDVARGVFGSWAEDPREFKRWEIARALSTFHEHAGTAGDATAVSAQVRPVGGQVKGVDGPEWVLACVQLDVRVVVVEQVRFGYGHCSRMQWDHGRWTIAAGRAPAPAPSTWPGSERSRQAGWRTWAEPAGS